jgi:hypothetical protein
MTEIFVDPITKERSFLSSNFGTCEHCGKRYQKPNKSCRRCREALELKERNFHDVAVRRKMFHARRNDEFVEIFMNSAELNGGSR